MKLCKDCKYYREKMRYSEVLEEYVNMSECQASLWKDLVDGSTNYVQCSELRKNDWECGVEGKWFEPREDSAPDVLEFKLKEKA